MAGRVTALVTAALLSASAARAVEVVGEWRGEDGGPRRVVLDGTTARLQLTWPTGEQVSLVGVARGGHAFLREAGPETPGVAGVLEGRDAGRRPVRSVEVRIRAGDDDHGVAADALLREGRRFVTREVWTRPGRPAVDLLSIAPQVGWCPKDGPLTVRLRVRNAPVTLRLRVVVAPSDGEADARRVGFYMERVEAFESRPTRRIVRELALNEGAPLEPGEHTVTFDGRDGTADRRLLLGGRYWIAVVGQPDLRAEEVVVVAPPRTEYVGPRWPRRAGADGDLADPGRDRTVAHAAVVAGAPKVGLGKPAGAHLGGVTSDDALAALSRAAMVTIATHGSERSISFYTAAEDVTEDPAHVVSLRAPELDAFAEATGGKPLADLHTVIVWACLAGKRELPGRLVAMGADVVVGFTTLVYAAGHERFVTRYLKAALDASKTDPGRLKSALEIAGDAAHHADQVWRDLKKEHPARYAALLARGARPLEHEGVLRIVTAPGVDPAREPLAPGRWGCSTN